MLKKKRDSINDLPTAYDEALLKWDGPETLHHNRGTAWKVVMGLLLIGMITYGILTNAWTFSLVIAVFAVVYYLHNREHPKDVEVKISNIGIKVGNRKYPYSRIRAYWFIYEPPFVSTLNIRVDGELVNDIKIQLHDQNPGPVRQLLSQHLPELEGQTEKMSDIFFRLFKI